MNQNTAALSIYSARGNYKHPLDESNRRLWSIMCMAARDIEAMTDEKAAEGAGEQR